jgi:nicotinate-nucleotide adenylyltransferase
VIGLFGGAFDPPHNGHVELVREALSEFGLERLVVLVVANPGHKAVALDGSTRLELARAAFPDHDVELDEHARTIDLLRERRFDDPLFLIGADEFCDFLSWKEPEGVLELACLGVATRPGFPRERLERVLDALSARDRVRFFEIEPVAVSSSELRARIGRGEPIEGLVPPAVEELIRGRGLYRPAGYTRPAGHEET